MSKSFLTELVFHLSGRIPSDAVIVIFNSIIRHALDQPLITRNPLHIIIRYEIEKEYFDGKLTVDTIEEAWNRKYQEYLGFTPKNHQEGILQDVHWASGCVGYFQGYALGDAYAAQFAHKLLADCPDAFEKLGKGDSSVIGNWLKEHIHQYGQTYSAREMLKKATGEELNTGYYIEYLKDKYLH